MIFYTSGLKLE